MLKHCFILFVILLSLSLSAQTPKDSTIIVQDSTRYSPLLEQVGNGYFPTKYWNFDLKYLVKFNQYEGLRTGLGGITNDNFSEKYRINSYVVYGFKDHRFKYKIGGGARLYKDTKTWLNFSYTDDLEETGSSKFLTDRRFFSFFEPRLLNIDLFHKHITSALSLEHQITPHLSSEVQVATSNVRPTYSYNYVLDDKTYDAFETTTAQASVQWSPFNVYDVKDGERVETKNGFPKFSLQYTKSFREVLNADFNFSKLDFRTVHKITYKNKSFSTGVLTAGLAHGDTPLTHLYHAYPNNINKTTILNRFSVAGINSFETMFFNEFFSDRFTTIVAKHYFKPFAIAKRFNPQLVLISRFAIGNINNMGRHQNVSFGTLKRGYTETGLEVNKLFLGFGLSLTYRYGAYHLPEFNDNIALKFTFNITL